VGHDGLHGVSCLVSVRQQCFKIIIVYGPFAFIHRGRRYER
jgi:hypothetical protein